MTGGPFLASADVAGRATTGGVVVTVGTYPGVVGVDLQELMFRDITMVGARVYTSEEVAAAVGLIERGDIDPACLISDVLPLEAGPAALDALRTGRAIKVLLAGPGA